MAKPIIGSYLLDDVSKALGLDPQLVRRITLDISYDDLVIISVEMLAGEAIRQVSWSQLSVEVKVSNA